MNIYNIKEMSLGETTGISYNIYISGCSGYCEGCHSDHTWNFDTGWKLDLDDLIAHMQKTKDFKFDHICVLGGEPLDQPEEELVALLERIKKEYPNKPLWLYTSFRLMEVSDAIKKPLDYLKTGKFLIKRPPAKEQHGVFLVSNNQVIHKLKQDL